MPWHPTELERKEELQREDTCESEDTSTAPCVYESALCLYDTRELGNMNGTLQTRMAVEWVKLAMLKIIWGGMESWR